MDSSKANLVLERNKFFKAPLTFPLLVQTERKRRAPIYKEEIT